jgi:hypothetical protein
MPNSRDILYRVGYTRTLIDIASAGYEKEKAGTMAESLASRSTCSSSLRSHSAWWLLARHSDSQREVLTLTHGGSRAVTEHVGRGGGGARELKPRTFRESSGGHNSVAQNRCAVGASAHLLRHFSCPRGDQRVRYISTLSSGPTIARNVRLRVVPTCVYPPEGGRSDLPSGAPPSGSRAGMFCELPLDGVLAGL